MDLPESCALQYSYVNSFVDDLDPREFIFKDGTFFVVRSNFSELNIKATTEDDAINQFKKLLKKKLKESYFFMVDDILKNLF